MQKNVVLSALDHAGNMAKKILFALCLAFALLAANVAVYAEIYNPGSDGTNGHGGGSGHNGSDGGNGTSGKLTEDSTTTISSPRNVGGKGGHGENGDGAGPFHSAGRGGYGGNGGSGEATVNSGVDVHFNSDITLGGTGGIGGDGGGTAFITDSGTGGYGGNGGTGLFNINGKAYINSTLTVGGPGGAGGSGGIAAVKDGGEGGASSYGGEGTVNIATGGYLWSGPSTAVLIGGKGGNAGFGGNGLLFGGDGGDGLKTGGLGLLQVDGDLLMEGKLYVGGSGGNGGDGGDGLAGTGGKGGRGAMGGTGSIGIYSGKSQFQNTVDIGGNGGAGGNGGYGFTLYGGIGGNGGKGGRGTLYGASDLSFAGDVLIGGNGGQGGDGGNSIAEFDYWDSYGGTGGSGGDGTFSGKGILAFSNLTIGGGGGNGGRSGTGMWTGEGGDGGAGGYGSFNFLGGQLTVDGRLAVGAGGGNGGRSGDAHVGIYRPAISGAGGNGGTGGNGVVVFNGNSIIHGMITVGGNGGQGGSSGYAAARSDEEAPLDGTTGDGGHGGAGGEGTMTIKGIFEGTPDILVGGNGGNGGQPSHVTGTAGVGGSGGAGGAGTLVIDAQTTKLANVHVGGTGGHGSNTEGSISEGPGGRGGAGGTGVLSIHNGTTDIGGGLIVGGNGNFSGTGGGIPHLPTGAGGNGLLEVKGGTTTITSTSHIVKIGGDGGNINENGQQGGNGGEGTLTVSEGEITFKGMVQLGGNGGNGKGNIIGGNGSLSITGGTINFLNTVTLGGEGTSYGMGNVNIGGGRVVLDGTADMRLNGIGAFSMTGGTLATTVKGTVGHEIRANTMSIGNHAVLEFDLSGANATTFNLRLNGYLANQIGGGIIRVTGIAAAPSSGVLYNLVAANSAHSITDTGSLYLNHETTAYRPDRNDPYWYSLAVADNASTLQLISVANPGGNTTLTWNTGNGVWDEATKNWLGKLNGYNVLTYKDGDDVRFLSALPDGTTVAVQNTGVNPKSMAVGNPGSWTFTGDELKVDETLSISKNATVTLDLKTRAENLLVDTGATLNVFSNGNVSVGSATFGPGSHVGVAIVDLNVPAITVDAAANWSVDDTAVLDITGYHLGDKAVLFQAVTGTLTNADLFKTVTVAGIEIGSQTSLEFFLNPVTVTLDNGDQDIVAKLGGLVWYNGTSQGLGSGDAHGTFNVRTRFHVGETLVNNDSGNGAAFGWDGATLTKTGQGTLYLDAANTYAGGTFIENGGIVATDVDALGTGTVHFNGGNLVLDWNHAGNFSNNITGDGQFTVRSGSDVTISNNNVSFAGETIIESAATLNLRHINAVGDSLLTVYGTANIESDFDNHFRGDGHIVFSYGGLVMDYANDGFTGTVAFDEFMTLGHRHGFGDAGQINIQDTLTLDFDGRFNTPVVGGSGGAIIVENGRLIGIDTDNADYKGTFTVGNNAFVSMTHMDAIGDSQLNTTVTNHGTLHFNFADSGSYAKDITGTGGIIKSGANEWTLAGTLTYNGATIVRGGTLVADLPGGTDLYLRNDGTTFQILSKSMTLNTLDGSGGVVFDGNGKSLAVQSGNFGDGEIRNLDQLTIGVDGDFTAGSVTAAGLEVQAGAKLAIAPDSRIVLDGGASFGANSTLGVAITDTSIPMIQIGDTSRWSVDSTATLDIQGYRLRPAVLFETTDTDFTAGDMFQKITVAGYEISGPLTEDRFIDLLAVTINADNAKQIIAASGPLVWYNGVTPGTENYDAHGTFNIGTNFRLEEQLNDNTSGNGAYFGWDGKTLKKTGGGLLVLGAENTYTGGTLLVEGTIVMTNAAAVGTGEVDISALAAVDVIYAGVLSNKFKGAGTLNLWDDLTITTNNSGFAGSVNINHGSTTATHLFSLGNNVTTTLEDDTTLIYNVNENGTVVNSIGGDGSFVKDGNGNLTVTGTQNYSGSTSVLAGILQMNLPTATDLSIHKNAAYENISSPNIVLAQLNGAGRLDARNANLTIGSGDFSGGTLENIGGFTKDSAETLVINGTQNIAGHFTLADGTLVLTGPPSLAIAGDATFGRGTTLSFSVDGLADGTTVMTANNAMIGLNTTLNITGYNGETELILLQTNNVFVWDFTEYLINGVPATSNRITFDTFFVPGGIQKTPNAIVLEKAHLVWNNTEDFSAHGTFLIGEGTVTINRDLADNPNGNAYMYNPADQQWWDGKSLTKTGEGTLVLNGQNTFTGDIHVQEGTLAGTHVNSFGDPNSAGKFILEGGSTLQFGDDDVHVTKTIEGFGRLLKTGNSSLTFSGNADNAHGIFQQNGGTVNLNSDWGGYYLMTSGLLTTNGDRSIMEGALFADGVIDLEGTLTVGRRLVMEDVIVKVRIGANEQAGTFNDKIVADEIFLNNAELDIDLSELSLNYFRSQKTLSWTILESQNGIYGDFSNVDNLVSNRLFDADYGVRGTDWVLELTIVDAPFFGFNYNTWQVAGYLNDAQSEAGLQMAPLLFLLGRFVDDEDYRRAMDGLRGSEIHADARKMALWQPWRHAYKNLYENHTCGSGRNIWVEGYGRDTAVHSDGNAVRDNEKRSCVTTGFDARLNRWAQLGFFFGYGNPRLTNRLGHVEADDYTFALTSKTRVSGDWHALGFFGYGHQNYTTTRYDFLDRHDAKYGGDSMYASLQWYRQIAWRRGVTLYPLMALDYQNAWTGKTVENGIYGQSIAGGNLEELTLRFGLDARFQQSDRLDVRTRLQYGVQVGGHRYATAQSRFTASSTSETMGLRGIDPGRSALHIGIGGNRYLDSHKCRRLFADYGCDLGERSTAHTGQVGFVAQR